MKTFIFIGTTVLALVIVVVMTGWYPVAMVGGSPIFFRTLQRIEAAEEHYANMQAEALGKKPVDFSTPENKNILTEGRKEILSSLIEDKVIVQEGNGAVSGFDGLVQSKVGKTLAGGQDMDKAVKLAYNLSLNDFQNLLLMPQARRDVLQEGLAKKSQNFDDWLRGVLKKKNIRLFFLPFSWDGERVK